MKNVESCGCWVAGILFLVISCSYPEGKNASVEEMKLCPVFLFQESHSNYTCDYDNICTVKGVYPQFNNPLETVVCCHSNLCNSVERATKAVAYHFSASCHLKPEMDGSCSGILCLNSTTFAPSGTAVWLEYDCGNESTSATAKCHKMLSSAGSTCLCSKRHCNQPKDNQSTSAVLLTVPPFLETQSERKWTFVGTMVAVIVLLVLFLMLVAIGIKKFRENRAEHVTYTYTQLTADLAEDNHDTDDEYMLIG